MQGWRHLKKVFIIIFPHTVNISVSKNVALKGAGKKLRMETGTICIWKERNKTKYNVSQLQRVLNKKGQVRKVYLDRLSNYVSERKADESFFYLFIFLHFLASIKWLHFTPQWCTETGRASLSPGKSTAEQCEKKCKSGCLSVEWWENMRLCYECTDPSKKTAYTNTKDLAYPPQLKLNCVAQQTLKSGKANISSSSSSSSSLPSPSSSALTTSLFTFGDEFREQKPFLQRK